MLHVFYCSKAQNVHLCMLSPVLPLKLAISSCCHHGGLGRQWLLCSFHKPKCLKVLTDINLTSCTEHVFGLIFCFTWRNHITQKGMHKPLSRSSSASSPHPAEEGGFCQSWKWLTSTPRHNLSLAHPNISCV